MIKCLICSTRLRNSGLELFISKLGNIGNMLCQLVRQSGTDYDIFIQTWFASNHHFGYCHSGAFTRQSHEVEQSCMNQNWKIHFLSILFTCWTKRQKQGHRNGNAEEIMGQEQRVWAKRNQILCLLFPEAVHASASINLHDEKKKTERSSSPPSSAPSAVWAAEVGNRSWATLIRSQQGSVHLAGCSWRAD